MFRKTRTEEQICLSDRVVRRARQAMMTGPPSMWVDQTLYLIGQNVTHHQAGDPLLDEAIQSAEALLALLTEMRRQEMT